MSKHADLPADEPTAATPRAEIVAASGAEIDAAQNSEIGAPRTGFAATVAGWAARVFALDRRSLAVFRIGIGIILLANLAILAGDISAFYTDDGLLPRDACRSLGIEERFTVPPYWVSLHMLSGGWAWQATLFVVMAGFAAAMTIGYRTKWAVLGSWILLVGLQARNPSILQGGDDALRCLLFWSIFLPLGDRWSWDARRRAARGRAVGDLAAPVSMRVASLATAAFILQLGSIYVFSGMLKTHAAWRVDFTALQYALEMDHFTSAFGLWLVQFPTLLKLLTASTLVLEIFGPLALLVPWRSWWPRMLVVCSFIGLHLGIELTMALGLFPLTCIICWLALAPTGFWKFVSARAAKPTREVRTVDSIVDSVIDTRTLSFGGNLLVASLMAYMMLLNLTRLNYGTIYAQMTPGPLRTLGEAAQLEQFWCMFSPRPYDFGCWFDLRGTLADGSHVNLLNCEDGVCEQRPDLPSAQFRSLPWRKCVINLYERNCPMLRTSMAEFLRRRWDAAHAADQQLVEVELIIRKHPATIGGCESKIAHGESQLLYRWAKPEATSPNQPAT